MEALEYENEPKQFGKLAIDDGFEYDIKIVVKRSKPEPKKVESLKEKMKKFSPLIFIISTTLIGILTFASFISGMALRGDISEKEEVILFIG